MSKWKCAIVSMSNSEILGRYKMIDRENDTDLRGRQEALRSEAMEPVTEDKIISLTEQLQEREGLEEASTAERVRNKTKGVSGITQKISS